MLWIILICLNCDVQEAQRSGWSAGAVQTGDQTLFSWRQEDRREFSTRRECMRVIRRENPESDFGAPDDYGQIEKVTHYPDYVERFQSIPLHMNAEVNIGCFSIPRRTP